MFDALSAHPMIAAARVKEPAFFCKADPTSVDYAEYDAQYDFDPDRHVYALEASTAYTKAPLTDPCATAAAMRRSGRRFRFMYLVRDPIERMASHIRNQIDDGTVTVERRFRHLALVEYVSRYAEQLERFRSGWPDCELAVFDYDDVIDPQSDVLSRMLDWLGLPACDAVGISHGNRSRSRLRTDEIFTVGQQRFLRSRLAPDIDRFGREWGIDVAKWGCR
ncbi:hypothetical protein [Thalassobaculum sp.]|uniref:hypothetical protein n=1 Tax=Thalassobaculum sp. TaxID=2022740 RepID=UPI0032EF2D30